jgi:hypothetical protein
MKSLRIGNHFVVDPIGRLRSQTASNRRRRTPKPPEAASRIGHPRFCRCEVWKRSFISTFSMIYTFLFQYSSFQLEIENVKKVSQNFNALKYLN